MKLSERRKVHARAVMSANGYEDVSNYFSQLEAENAELKRALAKANRFNELAMIESPPAWDKDSPFQEEIDALLKEPE